MAHPSELKSDDYLAYSGDTRRETSTLSDGGATISLSAVRSFGANSGEFLADMAAEGLGAALLPGFNIAEHLRSGRLVHVFEGWTPPELLLTLYDPPFHKLPPRIAALSKSSKSSFPRDLRP